MEGRNCMVLFINFHKLVHSLACLTLSPCSPHPALYHSFSCYQMYAAHLSIFNILLRLSYSVSEPLSISVNKQGKGDEEKVIYQNSTIQHAFARRKKGRVVSHMYRNRDISFQRARRRCRKSNYRLLLFSIAGTVK